MLDPIEYASRWGDRAANRAGSAHPRPGATRPGRSTKRRTARPLRPSSTRPYDSARRRDRPSLHRLRPPLGPRVSLKCGPRRRRCATRAGRVPSGPRALSAP
jgi:hypothetical protein